MAFLIIEPEAKWNFWVCRMCKAHLVSVWLAGEGSRGWLGCRNNASAEKPPVTWWVGQVLGKKNKDHFKMLIQNQWDKNIEVNIIIFVVLLDIILKVCIIVPILLIIYLLLYTYVVFQYFNAIKVLQWLSWYIRQFSLVLCNISLMYIFNMWNYWAKGPRAYLLGWWKSNYSFEPWILNHYN